MSQQSIYLDYAAATPLDPEVLLAMQPYFTELFYNPSANYLAAGRVRQAVESARAEVARWLGAKPSEIIFTAGGTEANNLAIHGIMRRFSSQENMVISAVEHESVLEPAKKYRAKLAPVIADGRIDEQALVTSIDDSTVLVSIMYANNEIGTIQPLRRIAQQINKIRHARKEHGNTLPLYFHTDACQAANYLDLHVDRLGVDLMTLNGGKIYGPKQSGLLFCKTGITIEPQILGGGQERNLRSGTEQVANIVGLAKALSQAQEHRHTESDRLSNLQRFWLRELVRQLPSVIINGASNHRLPNNVHVTFPGQDNERLLFALDEAGVQAAAGSACSASSDEPSHVLDAMGISKAAAQSSLRFTMGRQTTEPDVKQTIKLLQKLTTETARTQ